MQIEFNSIPEEPGVYQFFDKDGSILYIGKAKNLKNRLSSYFVNTKNLHPRTQRMLELAAKVEWITLQSEKEALLAEASMIFSQQPPFNVKLKDNKVLPWIAIDTRKDYPSIAVWYGKAVKGVQRFGPYLDRRTAQDLVEACQKIWGIRPCVDKKFNYYELSGKPCMLGMIDLCSAPCTRGAQASMFLGKKPENYDDTYKHILEEVKKLLNGQTKSTREKLTSEMQEASKNLLFEKAAKLRDRLALLDKVNEHQVVIADSNASFDVAGGFSQNGKNALQILQVREGRLVGSPVYVFDENEDTFKEALNQYYVNQSICPSLIIVQASILDKDLEEALSEKCGHKVKIETRSKGAKYALLEKAIVNAEGAIKRELRRSASDDVGRIANLEELQKALALKKLPKRIEAIDISHLAGQGTVSVISVLIDGLPNTSEYRRYRLEDKGHPDDIASMHEVIGRRLDRIVRERAAGKAPKVPDLLLIDGGPTQLNAAVQELKKRALFEEIPVVSLAKKFEEIYRPNKKDPLVLARDSKALYILEYARDETHRASNVYQKKLRKAMLTKSELDNILGLGPSRKKKLLAAAGTVANLKKWDEERWEQETWLPLEVRKAIQKKLKN